MGAVLLSCHEFNSTSEICVFFSRDETRRFGSLRIKMKDEDETMVSCEALCPFPAPRRERDMDSLPTRRSRRYASQLSHPKLTSKPPQRYLSQPPPTIAPRPPSTPAPLLPIPQPPFSPALPQQHPQSTSSTMSFPLATTTPTCPSCKSTSFASTT